MSVSEKKRFLVKIAFSVFLSQGARSEKVNKAKCIVFKCKYTKKGHRSKINRMSTAYDI